MNTGVIFLLLLLFTIVCVLWGIVNRNIGRNEGMLKALKEVEQIVNTFFENKESKQDDSGTVEENSVE